MRKLLYTFAALASMLAVAASCQRETPVGSSPDGDLIDVSMNFTVDDGRPATKAIGDGTTASVLTFYAYDEHGNYLYTLSSSATISYNASSLAGTVSLKVVKGMKYQFVMLATAPSAIGSYYTVDAANKTLAVNYSSIATAQKEDSDFFYFKSGVTSFTASGESKTATLKRPLAQLNVGSTAEDFAVATKSGIKTDALKTGYVLNEIPNQLSLLDGTVSGSVDVTLNTATRPSAEDLAVSGTNYKWVAMAYVLMSEAGQTTDVTLNVEMTNTSDEALSPISRTVTSVPLKRNYRTNILGNIFSIDAMFNVSVDQNFEATDGGNINVDYIAVNSVADLNTTLTTNKANTQSQTYVVTTAEATTGATTDIVIPDNTKAASLVFQLNEIATGVNSIVIRDEHPSGGESIQYGNDITLEVPAGFAISNITVNAPYSHVYVKKGNVTTLVASTGGDTIVIADGTTVETLTVKCGNVRIEKGGKVTSIEKAEGNEEKTFVYVDEFNGWTKLLEQRSTVLIPVVCGVEISPEDVVFPYDNTKKAYENGTAFHDFAVNEANKDKTILIPEGEYVFTGTSGQGSKFGMEYGGEGFNFSFVGLGNPEKVIFKAQKSATDPAGGYHAMAFDAREHGHTVTLANLTLERVAGGRCPLYIKHGLTVDLRNVYFKKGTHSDPQAIEIDNASVYPGSIPVGKYWPNTEISAAAIVNAYGCVFEEDCYVGLTANPQVTSGNVSYIYFNFDNKCVNLTAEKCRANGKSSTGSNLFVNGEPLPPYTTDGQLAIKDDEGNWQIVTGYKYDESKTANENDVAFTSFFKSQADGTTIYMTPGVYLGTPYSGYNQVLEQNLNFVGYGDGVVLQSPGKEADTQGKSGFEVRSYAASGTPDHHNVGLKNIKVIGGWRKQFNSWSSAMYVRGNLSLMLEDVDLITYGNVAFEFDASDPFMSDESAYGELILKNVSIPEGKKINVSGAPTTQATVRITYDTACTNISAETFTCQNCDGTKIYINGVELAH